MERPSPGPAAQEALVSLLADALVERLRPAVAGQLEADDMASATLVSVMAYAGLRPAEATALAWRHVGDRTLLVEQSTDGEGGTKVTKTGVIRTVPLLSALADDLAAWRAASNPPSNEAPIEPRADGGWWTATDYRNWRRRRFDPAVQRAGLPVTRPYDLRHSYASLMVQAGYSAVELAAELGHSPTLTLDTYAHVFSSWLERVAVRPGPWEQPPAVRLPARSSSPVIRLQTVRAEPPVPRLRPMEDSRHAQSIRQRC